MKKATTVHTKTLNVFVLDYVTLPDEVRDMIANRQGFANDVFLHMTTLFDPEELTNTLALDKHYKDEVEGGYEGTLEEFLYWEGLQFDYWLAQQGYDLTDVDKVFVEVCW